MMETRDRLVRPTDQLTLAIKASLDPVACCSTEKIIFDVLFPGPNHLHRFSDRLRSNHSLDHEIRSCTSSKPAPHVGRVDVDLFRR